MSIRKDGQIKNKNWNETLVMNTNSCHYSKFMPCHKTTENVWACILQSFALPACSENQNRGKHNKASDVLRKKEEKKTSCLTKPQDLTLFLILQRAQWEARASPQRVLRALSTQSRVFWLRSLGQVGRSLLHGVCLLLQRPSFYGHFRETDSHGTSKPVCFTLWKTALRVCSEPCHR